MKFTDQSVCPFSVVCSSRYMIKFIHFSRFNQFYLNMVYCVRCFDIMQVWNLCEFVWRVLGSTDTQNTLGFFSWLLFSVTGRFTIPPLMLLIGLTSCHRYLTSGTISARSPSAVRRSNGEQGWANYGSREKWIQIASLLYLLNQGLKSPLARMRITFTAWRIKMRVTDDMWLMYVRRRMSSKNP